MTSLAPTIPPRAALQPARVAVPRGLPGFPELTGLRLEPLEPGQPRYLRLSNVDGPAPAFIAMVQPEGGAMISAEDVTGACRELEMTPGNVVVMFVVTLEAAEGGTRLCINRRAPLLLDTEREILVQHVLPRPDYRTREPLIPSPAG